MVIILKLLKQYLFKNTIFVKICYYVMTAEQIHPLNIQGKHSTIDQ